MFRGIFFSGQSPAEADLNLLETARRCELYGVKMHPAKVSLRYFWECFWYRVKHR